MTFLLTHPARDVTLFAVPVKYLPLFLLTHPARDVTNLKNQSLRLTLFLLTHPARDVTDYETETSQGIFNFYSHIPRGM